MTDEVHAVESFLDRVRREAEERQVQLNAEQAALTDRMQAIKDEMRQIGALLKALPKSQLESGDTSEDGGEQSNGVATIAMVRDWGRQRGDWFRVSEMADALPGSHTTINARVNELLDRGTFERRGPERGPGVMFRWVKPPNEHPHERPRGEPHVPGVGSERHASGVPVAHTRPIGGSGKPGLDKKRAEQGRTVKRERNGT